MYELLSLLVDISICTFTSSNSVYEPSNNPSRLSNWPVKASNKFVGSNRVNSQLIVTLEVNMPPVSITGKSYKPSTLSSVLPPSSKFPDCASKFPVASSNSYSHQATRAETQPNIGTQITLTQGYTINVVCTESEGLPTGGDSQGYSVTLDVRDI